MYWPSSVSQLLFIYLPYLPQIYQIQEEEDSTFSLSDIHQFCQLISEFVCKTQMCNLAAKVLVPHTGPLALLDPE